MANILVTGAGGFIGRHMTRTLSGPHRVLGVGRGDAPFRPDGFAYHKTGFTVPELRSLMRGFRPDYLVHCAGPGSVAGSFADPYAGFVSGPYLTYAVMEALRLEAPACTTVFLSSAAVYGAPPEGLIGADTPVAPISPYGFHKLMSESVLDEFKTLHGMDGLILRVLSCYGAGLRKQIFWDVCRKAMTGRVELFGTGLETRDFIHVNDLCNLVGEVVASELREGTLPVGSGKAVTISELAFMLVDFMGLAGTHVVFAGEEHTGNPAHWQCDRKLIAKLGFVPTTTLEEGVKEYAEWFNSLHKEGGSAERFLLAAP